MKDITVSARIPEDLDQQLNRVAEALKRSRSWVIEEALRAYIPRETAFRAAVEAGIRALDAGDLVDHSEVVADVRRWPQRKR